MEKHELLKRDLTPREKEIVEDISKQLIVMSDSLLELNLNSYEKNLMMSMKTLNCAYKGEEDRITAASNVLVYTELTKYITNILNGSIERPEITDIYHVDTNLEVGMSREESIKLAESEFKLYCDKWMVHRNKLKRISRYYKLTLKKKKERNKLMDLKSVTKMKVLVYDKFATDAYDKLNSLYGD